MTDFYMLFNMFFSGHLFCLYAESKKYFSDKFLLN